MQSLKHWIVQRITAIILAPSVLLILYWFWENTQEILIDVYNGTSIIIILILSMLKTKKIIQICYIAIILGVLLIHIIEGIENILNDYVQDEKVKKITIIYIKCIQVMLLKAIIIYMLL